MSPTRWGRDPELVDLVAEAVSAGWEVTLDEDTNSRLSVYIDGVEWTNPANLGWTLSNAGRVGLSEEARQQAETLHRRRRTRRHRQRMRKLSTAVQAAAHGEQLPTADSPAGNRGTTTTT